MTPSTLPQENSPQNPGNEPKIKPQGLHSMKKLKHLVHLNLCKLKPVTNIESTLISYLSGKNTKACIVEDITQNFLNLSRSAYTHTHGEESTNLLLAIL